jgi:amino acid adenylation domain-containing protein
MQTMRAKEGSHFALRGSSTFFLVHQRFEEQTNCTPHALAVECGKDRLTYCQLNERANRLAHHLQHLGVGAEACVGILLERSVELVVGLLATLKAGGAYFPLDPANPPCRQNSLLEDVKPPVILAHEHLTNQLLAYTGQVVSLNAGQHFFARHPTTTPGSAATPDSLAYLPFTSGSTGIPKGVCVLHRNIVHVVCENDYAGFGPDEVFLHLAPLAFDASTFEIWGALLNGARLVIAPPGQPTLSELGELLCDGGVTTLWLTAGLFHLVAQERPEAFSGLRQLLTGGDILAPASVRQIRQRFPKLRLVNGYGPTETTTFACCHTVEDLPAEATNVPIGRPIRGSTVFILSEDLQPVAPGAEGELYIGGAGLSRGYWNRPTLTDERFVYRQFGDQPTTRLYRTGDRVRMQPDGNLQFFGRLDDQIKLRGFRIEPAEIEAVLARHPDIVQTTIAVRELGPGEKRLVAYFIPRGKADMPALRSYLRQQLPEYMVPSALIPLTAMPLTANGKVDRARLPDPATLCKVADKSPANYTEAQLVSIWQRLLRIPGLGVHDDFFDLGADSLLAMRLLAEIDKYFGQTLSTATLCECGTIAELSEFLVQNRRRSRWTSLVAIQPLGTRPPFYCVHPIGGQVIGFRLLAKSLSDDQPFYGLQVRELTGSCEPLLRIEDMASHYLSEILQHQPSGPYYLGGYSLGGIIAWEMARQLYDQRRELAFLAVLDDGPAMLNPPKMCVLRNIGRLLADLPRWFRHARRQRSPEKLMAAACRKVKARLRRLSPATATAGAVLEEFVDLMRYSESERQRLLDHFRALRNYVFRPWPGRVSLFRARIQPFFLRPRPHDLGWGNLAGQGVAIRDVPGDHLTMMNSPNIQLLGAQLADALANAQLLSERQIRNAAA